MRGVRRLISRFRSAAKVTSGACVRLQVDDGRPRDEQTNRAGLILEALGARKQVLLVPFALSMCHV